MAKAKTDLIKLVIVESPAKARKIGGYLGDGYVVEASVGHIRDLPQRAADIPKEFKKIAWAKEGVDIENDFAPLYVINPDKRAKVAELKELMKSAGEILLATDEDREGEAISWHLLEALQKRLPAVPFVYYADNANAPYGVREAQDIYDLTVAGVERLPMFNPVKDPDNPAAREDGFVYYPAVDYATAMVDGIEALRAYEANIQAVEATRSMIDAGLRVLA